MSAESKSRDQNRDERAVLAAAIAVALEIDRSWDARPTSGAAHRTGDSATTSAWALAGRLDLQRGLRGRAR